MFKSTNYWSFKAVRLTAHGLNSIVMRAQSLRGCATDE